MKMLSTRIHRNIEMQEARSRVPPAEVYSSIFRVTWVSAIEHLSTGATPIFSGLKLDRSGVFPDPVSRKVGCIFGETASAPRSQMRGLETISKWMES
jgi:hypothetical protein